MKEWMPGARRVETAARGGYSNDGQMVASAIVTHSIEGWLSELERWARERPVHHFASYHLVISRLGEIVQFVPIDTGAWHAGRYDNDPVSGQVVRPPWPGWKGRGTSVNSYTVGVGREGFNTDPWTPVQVAALERVYRYVLGEHGLTSSVRTLIGHRDIAPRTRAHDPGAGWDALDYVSLSDEQLSPPPGGLAQRIDKAWRGSWEQLPATGTEDVWKVSVKR